MVPFVDLKAQYQSIKNEIDGAIASVIEETAFIGGKYVETFKAEFIQLYGTKYFVPCANGTDAIYIILRMLGIGTGDEVITVGNSWISTSETISQTGAQPVFVDVDEYFTIDVSLIEKSITPKTKAIIPVHLYGQMCDMDGLDQLSKKYGIPIIEDCAQSHFSSYKGVRAGLRGIAASISFFPGKNLGAYGDAGGILTQDLELANKCQMFATHGALVKHQHKIEGINSRLDGLQAAILSAKLPYILEWTEKRNKAADTYRDLLKDVSSISLPLVRPDTYHSYHLFVILAEKRDELMAYLKSKGIETAIHYPTPLPFLDAYAYLNHKEEDFPQLVSNQRKILSLPIYPEITYEQIDYVCSQLKSFYTL